MLKKMSEAWNSVKSDTLQIPWKKLGKPGIENLQNGVNKSVSETKMARIFTEIPEFSESGELKKSARG